MPGNVLLPNVPFIMSQQHILQVSELTRKVRFMLESELNTVWLCGEISNFVAPSSGHWYLSLKDSRSQVRCAMFKGNNSRVRLTPKNGQQVLVRAKVSLYEPRGDFQLIIEQMDDAGEGLLRQQFDQLKHKLHSQGLFDPINKQALPAFIQTVGVVTSPTGAAVKDILTVLNRRNPGIKVIIYPALVQGEQAAADLVAAISKANNRRECDVLIIGRGGGSLEDLWSFNQEEVVLAIYHSALPTISAVGHEIDTTLADHTADLRAATPSAAAELVSQDQQQWLNTLTSLQKRLIANIQRHLLDQHKHCNAMQHRLAQVHPVQQLQNQQQKADQLSWRLQQLLQRKFQDVNIKPKQLHSQLMHLSPSVKLAQQQQALAQNEGKLITIMHQIHQHKSQKFGHVIEQLHIISPLATLARGYAITRNKKQQVIRSIEQVTLGDQIVLQVADGFISSQVSETKSVPFND
jgi:exodeoxyribonuclease VII large subunit